MNGALAVAASRYAAQGWFVFPCAPKDKRPVTAAGFKEATTNAEHVARWWAAEPHANIGLWPGPSGLLVVDIDSEAGETLAASLGLLAEPTLQVRTSKGRHLYFTAPGFPVGNVDVGAGIDIRGQNGYVIVPPSVHPSGTRYKWTGRVEELRPCPAAFAERLRVLSSGAAPHVAAPAGVIGEGGRNNGLAREAGRLLLKYAVAEATDRLWRFNLDRCAPPVGRSEVEAIVANIAKSETRKTALHLQTAEKDTARVVCLGDVAPEEIRWLWPGWIPLGKLTVLEGDPGLGKSTLSLALAAAVSNGAPLPGAQATAPAGVVIVTYEDGLADTIRPRLDAAGADVARVHAVQGITPPEGQERLVSLPSDAPSVFEAVARLGARLLIIDPLTAALSAETDSHRDADVRHALAPLARFAEESGAAVVVVRHLRKSAGRAISSGGGSIAIGAAARAVLAVHEDPDHPADTGARVLAVVKSNLAERPPSLLFRLASEPGQAARVEWGGTSPHTADKLAALRGESEGDAEREIDGWLRGDLEDGPQDRKEVLRRATAAGFSGRTLDRAAARLGVVRRQSGFGTEKRSEWSLSPIPPQSRQSRPIPHAGAIGAIGGATERERCPRCGSDELDFDVRTRAMGCEACARAAAGADLFNVPPAAPSAAA